MQQLTWCMQQLIHVFAMSACIRPERSDCVAVAAHAVVQVAGSGSGRKRSTLTSNFAVLSTSSTSSSVTYFSDVGAGAARTWLTIIGTTGVNSGDAISKYWGAVGQSYENAALQNLASGGAVTSGGISFGIVSAGVHGWIG
jgi:hypothetical protein